MKKNVFTVLTGVLISVVVNGAYGQNLLSNGGFESYYNCPTTNDQSAQALTVVNKFGTPDFYNCSYFPAMAHSGSGSMYIGAVKYTSFVTREGIIMQLDQPMTSGTTYNLSLYDAFGYKYPDPNFVPSSYCNCYKLGIKFLTSSTAPGDPISYDIIFDPESIVGNTQTPVYINLTGNFTPAQSYTHILIHTMPTSKTMSNDPSCLNTVIYNLIDDVQLVPLSVLGSHLNSFSVSIENNQGVCRWSVNDSKSVSHFQVKWSSDGVSWSSGEQIPAANTDSPFEYTYRISQLEPGPNLIRMYETDLNGSSTLLSEKVLNKDIFTDFELYPNPAKGSFIFHKKQEIVAPGILHIYDFQGRIVHSYPLNGKALNTEIDISGFSPGMYTVVYVTIETHFIGKLHIN